MYTDVNFKTKKALKDAIASGRKIGIFSPGPFPAPTNGWTAVEGPHFPQPHKWYAEVYVNNGIVERVK